MMRRSTPIVFVLLFATIYDFSRPAFAYIDPGSGSVLMQLLLGGSAGLIMLLNLFRERIADLVHSMRQRLCHIFGLECNTERSSKISSTSTKGK